MFLLPAIVEIFAFAAFVARVFPNEIAFGVEDLAIADICPAGGPVGVFGNAVPAVADVSALAEQYRAVAVFFVVEFDEVVIVDFAVFLAGAYLATALALGFDGVAAHQPVNNIEVMNVLFGDVVTAEPVEVVPVLSLIHI